MDERDRVLADAFDGQAARFERAPLQTDRAMLARLLAFARFPPGARLLDCGCGPGLVAEALLEAGHRVEGIDLSPEMVRRARERCARFGDRARFRQGSVLALPENGAVDGALSRLVLHHVPDPSAFVAAQARLVRPGGVVFAADHVTDPRPEPARWHQAIERARDRSHARNLTSGELVDLLGAAGLADVEAVEQGFALDFDEWFDRGTPAATKAEVRSMLLAGSARGFEPEARPDGGITIRARWALVRGVRPA